MTVTRRLVSGMLPSASAPKSERGLVICLAAPSFPSLASGFLTLDTVFVGVRAYPPEPSSLTSRFPEEKICFRTELETGATKLNAKVGHFMITTIFGTRPPDGVTPITDQNVRGRLGELFLWTRLGWRDDLNPARGSQGGVVAVRRPGAPPVREPGGFP